MKKILYIAVVLIIFLIVGYIVFIRNFDLFPSNRIELVKFSQDGSTYKIYCFKGNATVSNNIQLYRDEEMLSVSNTMNFYKEGKIIQQNDSMISVLLVNIEEGLQDTLAINFIEPIIFKSYKGFPP